MAADMTLGLTFLPPESRCLPVPTKAFGCSLGPPKTFCHHASATSNLLSSLSGLSNPLRALHRTTTQSFESFLELHRRAKIPLVDLRHCHDREIRSPQHASAKQYTDFIARLRSRAFSTCDLFPYHRATTSCHVSNHSLESGQFFIRSPHPQQIHSPCLSR